MAKVKAKADVYFLLRPVAAWCNEFDQATRAETMGIR